MEAILAKALEGQPVLTVLLAVAVAFLWRDLQKEREARVSLIREHMTNTATVASAMERIENAVTALKDAVRDRGK